VGDGARSEGEATGPGPWEAAYARFQTSEVETRKYVRRLRAAGAHDWPRDAEVVDLFCGRGNGLQALQRLEFARVEGVDLSPTLLAQYRGPARVHVGDCRALPFEDHSKDAVIIHGGLHHLPELPGDLDRVLSEIRRVLRRGGRFLAVEPWGTPFLAIVHGACRVRALRRIWPKLDALAIMIEHEHPIYPQWLAQPRMISDLFERHFTTVRCRTAWGKRMFLGHPRPIHPDGA
jgi:SAM-dependent methyltransferase